MLNILARTFMIATRTDTSDYREPPVRHGAARDDAPRRQRWAGPRTYV
jgi:hypothetical protein